MISLVPYRHVVFVSEKEFCLCVSQVPCATMSSKMGFFCVLLDFFPLFVCCVGDGGVIVGDKFLLW